MPTETKGGGQQLQVAKRQLVVITCVWKGKENTSHDDFIERFIYLTLLCNNKCRKCHFGALVQN